MKKIILMPDSFKGTMSSSEICMLMEKAIRNTYPTVEVLSIPVADGGEGTVEAFLRAVGGTQQTVFVKGPLFEDMQAVYGVIDGGTTAVIEMAACAGLPLIGERRDPCRATTYGVGQLIRHALEHGCKKVILGAWRQRHQRRRHRRGRRARHPLSKPSGNAVHPTGGTLDEIVHIDCSNRFPGLDEAELIAMCDIDNPLCGPSGAAAVFGPQKGADPETVRRLDQNLLYLSRLIEQELGVSVSQIPGAGAAGGMGGGAVAFLNAGCKWELKPCWTQCTLMLCSREPIMSSPGKVKSTRKAFGEKW